MSQEKLEVIITDKNAILSIRKIEKEQYDMLIEIEKSYGWIFESENEDWIFFSKDGWFKDFCKSANCFVTARMDQKINKKDEGEVVCQ